MEVDTGMLLFNSLLSTNDRAIDISFGLVKHPKALQLYKVMATTSKIYLVWEYAKGGELVDKVGKRRLKEDNVRKDARLAPKLTSDLMGDLICSTGRSLQYHDLNLMEMYRKISNAN
ncbi:hypothetical protein RJ639_046877 [Escallonia herrerae]|uniref:Protein kinase domain-containing protein n=1 Tax=Escallonia herrerae TaxID=1293975 RepID=A0AA88W566_9ASTE|nr:hypothetical protein RJ639_046877 [Escallonia herrerae]